MTVRLRDMFSDLILVLAALVPMMAADSYVLHLAWRNGLILSTIVALAIGATFLWEVRRGIYERLTRRTRVFIGLLLAADIILLAFSGFHSATIRFLVRAFSYCVTSSVIIFAVIEGIRQGRAKQILRSVQGDGTV